MKIKNKNKTKTETLKLWAEPTIINGEKISDAELMEFLDWSLINKNNDFDYFRYLKNNGKFKKITSTELTEFTSTLGKNKIKG